MALIPSVRTARRRVVAAAALVAVATALCACGGSAAAGAGDGGGSDGYTLRIGMVTKVAPDGVLGWAHMKGILKKNLAAVGVTDVELSTFATGPTLNSALTSGSIDVAAQGDTPALTLRSNGFASQAIAIDGFNTTFCLIGKKGGASTLAELAGKKVSAAPGTTPEQYLIELLKQTGLSTKITITNLQTNDAASAVRAGQIDAFVASTAMAGTLIAEGYPVIDKVSDHTGLYTTSVQVASEKFLDAHPDFATAWAKAFAEAVRSIKADPDSYWAFNAKVDKVTVGIAKFAFPLDALPDEAFSTAGIEQIGKSYDFLVDQGRLKKTFELTSWFATS